MQRLTREGEELLVAGRVALSDGGKRMVLVAQEEDLAEVPVGPRLDPRDPAEHGAPEVELHEGADRLGETGVCTHGEIQRADDAALDKLGEGRQGLAVARILVEERVVAL